MKRLVSPFIFAVMLLCASPALAVTGSGLPIPRFVTLKNDDINVRSGPGTRYPILWIYHRAGMPVEVVEEYDLWRKIRDIDGTTGWVHKTMLDGRRSVMIKGKEDQILRMDPEPHGRPLLKTEPMVTAKLMECQPDWCRIQVSGRKGWMEKKYLWGVYADEVIE